MIRNYWKNIFFLRGFFGFSEKRLQVYNFTIWAFFSNTPPPYGGLVAAGLISTSTCTPTGGIEMFCHHNQRAIVIFGRIRCLTTIFKILFSHKKLFKILLEIFRWIRNRAYLSRLLPSKSHKMQKNHENTWFFSWMKIIYML